MVRQVQADAPQPAGQQHYDLAQHLEPGRDPSRRHGHGHGTTQASSVAANIQKSARMVAKATNKRGSVSRPSARGKQKAAAAERPQGPVAAPRGVVVVDDQKRGFFFSIHPRLLVQTSDQLRAEIAILEAEPDVWMEMGRIGRRRGDIAAIEAAAGDQVAMGIATPAASDAVDGHDQVVGEEEEEDTGGAQVGRGSEMNEHGYFLA